MMPKYLVILEAQVEVEADEAGYAEEIAIGLVSTDELSASYIEEV
jgi:hypothetical protein